MSSPASVDDNLVPCRSAEHPCGASALRRLKDRESQIRYVEIALQVLSNEPTETSVPIRLWAIDVLDFYSEVKLSKEASFELQRKSIEIYNMHAKEIIRGMDR